MRSLRDNTKNAFNTYSESYLQGRDDLHFAGWDEDDNPFWTDENGKKYYESRDAQGDDRRGSDSGDNGKIASDYVKNNFGAPTISNGQVTNPSMVLGSWPGSQNYAFGGVPNTGGFPGATDIPQTAGPDKYSQESIRQVALENDRVQQMIMRGHPVVMERNNVVGGVPVRKSVLISPGRPGAEVYRVRMEGPMNTNGTLIPDKAIQFVYPPVPGSGDDTEVVNSGGGGSGSGTGGPSGGGSDCDCGGGGTGGASGGSGGAGSASGGEADSGNTTGTGEPTSVLDNATVTDTEAVTDTKGVTDLYWSSKNAGYDDLPQGIKNWIERFKNSPDYKRRVQPHIDNGDRVVMRIGYTDPVTGKRTTGEVVLSDGEDGADVYVVHANVNVYNDNFLELTDSISIGKEDGINRKREEIAPVTPLPLVPLPVSIPKWEPQPVPVPPLPKFVDGDDDDHDHDHHHHDRDAIPTNFRLTTDQIIPSPELNDNLQNIADRLRRNPDQAIVIQGNTPIPGLTMNQRVPVSINGQPVARVSVRQFLTARANAVRNLLIRQYGVNPRQIRTGPGRVGAGSANVTYRYARIPTMIRPLPIRPLRPIR